MPMASLVKVVVAVLPVKDSCDPLAPRILAKEVAAKGAEATCKA